MVWYSQVQEIGVCNCLEVSRKTEHEWRVC